MSVRKVLIIILVILVSVLEITVNAEENDRCANVKTSFEGFRKKRYLSFPPGTNMVITMSLLKAIMVHAPSGWNAVVEVDVLFPLLSAEMTNALFGKKFHHRQKREFWEKIEYAMSSYNYNGQSCIYRSICEAKLHLAAPGKSLVHDILRAIFSAPIHDPEFREEFAEVYTDLREPEICERIHDCPISLLEIVLGLNKNIT